MIVDTSNLPAHLTVPVGKCTWFTVPSFAGGGYNWSAKCMSAHGVAEVSVEMGKIPKELTQSGDGNSEPPSLMLVPELIVIQGTAVGDTVWNLILARPFDPTTPLAVHSIEVRVVET